MFMILKELCSLNAVSGNEFSLVLYIQGLLKDIGVDNVYIDPVGNLVCLSKGADGAKKIMVSAHVDEVGFQVIKRISSGKYRLKAVGSVNSKNAIDSIVTDGNVKGDIKAESDDVGSYDYDKLYLEIGDDNSLSTGDYLAFNPGFEEDDYFYKSKALDNRVGCYCLIEQLKRDFKHRADIYYIFTVQEETSFRGCRVARTLIKPDVHINIDTTPVHEMNSVEIGKGVAIKISDGYVSVPREDVEFMSSLGNSNNITYQFEVNDFGLSEAVITNEYDNGCRDWGISIPCEEMHTEKTKVSKFDLCQTVRFLNCVLCNL